MTESEKNKIENYLSAIRALAREAENENTDAIVMCSLEIDRIVYGERGNGEDL